MRKKELLDSIDSVLNSDLSELSAEDRCSLERLHKEIEKSKTLGDLLAVGEKLLRFLSAGSDFIEGF